MSKLDSFIRRMSAQRDCLNLVAEKTKDMNGPVLELGLGNGRTYDHLRELFGEDEVYVFDRYSNAHPDYTPDEEHLILGDFIETLPISVLRLPGQARLAHCDIGTGDKAQSVALAELIMPMVNNLLQSGGYVVSDQPFHFKGWTQEPLPEGVAEGRYHIYRKN